jgi:hypothetical protein
MGDVVEVVVPFGGVEAHPAVRRALVQGVMLRLSSVVRWIGRPGRARIASAISTRISVVDSGRGYGRSHRAQAVETVVLEPVERVLDEEPAHRRLLVGDGGAPGRVAVRVEEARRIGAEIVPVGAEVVVDDVEQDHQAAPWAASTRARRSSGDP